MFSASLSPLYLFRTVTQLLIPLCYFLWFEVCKFFVERLHNRFLPCSREPKTVALAAYGIIRAPSLSRIDVMTTF
jgi:hypothetical protein